MPTETRATPSRAAPDLPAAADTTAGEASLDGTGPAEAADTLAEVAPSEAAEAGPAPSAGEAARTGATPAGEPRGWTIYDELAADLAGLLSVRTLAGTPLAARPQLALIDHYTGQLLALTDAGELRRTARCARPGCDPARPAGCPHPPRGPGLGPPPDTDGYRPADPLDRFVRARDRRCRFPGCRARPMRCDLDHTLPWPAGPTSHHNLCCLCRHHHRLAHQAPGWTIRALPDGGLAWTTPGGTTLTTYPPRYGTDDHPPVTTDPDDHPDDDPHDDPPPF
jgi:hypothetical protein